MLSKWQATGAKPVVLFQYRNGLVCFGGQGNWHGIPRNMEVSLISLYRQPYTLPPCLSTMTLCAPLCLCGSIQPRRHKETKDTKRLSAKSSRLPKILTHSNGECGWRLNVARVRCKWTRSLSRPTGLSNLTAEHAEKRKIESAKKTDSNWSSLRSRMSSSQRSLRLCI